MQQVSVTSEGRPRIFSYCPGWKRCGVVSTAPRPSARAARRRFCAAGYAVAWIPVAVALPAPVSRRIVPPRPRWRIAAVMVFGEAMAFATTSSFFWSDQARPSSAAELLKLTGILLHMKTNTLRAERAMKIRTMVPVERVKQTINLFVELFKKYVPPERQQELLEEIRIAINYDDQPVGASSK
jgi:hypothetical protein